MPSLTHSLDGPREGEGAPGVQRGERCHIGVVGPLRDLDWPEKICLL